MRVFGQAERSHEGSERHLQKVRSPRKLVIHFRPDITLTSRSRIVISRVTQGSYIWNPGRRSITLIVPADLAFIDEDRERGHREGLAGRAGRKNRVGIDPIGLADCVDAEALRRTSRDRSRRLQSPCPARRSAVRAASTRRSKSVGGAASATAAAAPADSAAHDERFIMRLPPAPLPLASREMPTVRSGST